MSQVERAAVFMDPGFRLAFAGMTPEWLKWRISLDRDMLWDGLPSASFSKKLKYVEDA